MRKLTRALASLLTCLVPIVSLGGQGSATQDVISRARGEYYNLKRHSFNGFKAAIEPNWEVILGPSATQQNLKVFRALQFSMIVDAGGNVRVSHEVVNPEKIRVEPYVNQIYGNVNRLVTSFFGTWSMFVASSPFPDTGSQTRIENSGKEYQVFDTKQSADSMITLTSDLLITQWTLTNPTGKRIVKPIFEKTPHGLLLSGYSSTYEPSGEGIKTTLELQVEYQDVSGLKLPHRIRIKGMHGSEPVEAELEFNQYEMSPRQ